MTALKTTAAVKQDVSDSKEEEIEEKNSLTASKTTATATASKATAVVKLDVSDSDEEIEDKSSLTAAVKQDVSDDESAKIEHGTDSKSKDETSEPETTEKPTRGECRHFWNSSHANSSFVP